MHKETDASQCDQSQDDYADRQHPTLARQTVCSKELGGDTLALVSMYDLPPFQIIG